MSLQFAVHQRLLVLLKVLLAHLDELDAEVVPEGVDALLEEVGVVLGLDDDAAAHEGDGFAGAGVDLRKSE